MICFFKVTLYLLQPAAICSLSLSYNIPCVPIIDLFFSLTLPCLSFVILELDLAHISFLPTHTILGFVSRARWRGSIGRRGFVFLVLVCFLLIFVVHSCQLHQGHLVTLMSCISVTPQWMTVQGVSQHPCRQVPSELHWHPSSWFPVYQPWPVALQKISLTCSGPQPHPPLEV